MALHQHCFVFSFILPLKLLDGNISIVIPFVLTASMLVAFTELKQKGQNHLMYPLGQSYQTLTFTSKFTLIAFIFRHDSTL